MQPLLFTNTGYAIVFWIVYAIWLVPELVGTFIQRARGNAIVQDRGSQGLVIAAVVVGVSLNFSLPGLIPAATITWNRPLLFSIGIAFMLLGVALRWYAIWVLGAYFTRDVAVRPDQQVVQAGPYRFIRHPSYSGSLLTIVGLGLAMTNWASLAAITIIALAGYLYRVSVEEKVLRQGLGQPYEEYMRHTRRFIPFVL